MTQNLPLVALGRRIRFSAQDLSEARSGWIKSRAMLDAGLRDSDGKVTGQFSDKVRHQDEYLSITRYCEDARELIRHYDDQKAGDQKSSEHHPIFAIDPHLIRAHCEYWYQSNHKGFQFTTHEFDDEQAHLDQYRLFVYETILQDAPLALLDSGRREISELVAQFTQERDTRHSINRSEVELTLIKNIEKIKILSKFENDPEEALRQKFDELVTIGGGPALYQSLSLARLVGLLKRSNFYAPEAALRAHAKDHPIDTLKLETFSGLMRYMRINPAFLNESRNQFVEAYAEFRQLADIESNAPSVNRRHAPSRLRGGELHDLNALHENHVLNSCLDLAGLNFRFHYVTLSTRMFNFIRQFSQRKMAAMLLHPRTMILYRQNDLFAQHREDFTRSISYAIAFGKSLPGNEKISPDELEKFGSDLNPVLRSVRRTFAFSAPSRQSAREHMVEALRHMFDKSANLSNKTDGLAAVEDLDRALQASVEKVGDQFSASSPELTQTAWTAYKAFATDDDNKPHQAKVIIRKVVMPGNPDSFRYTCIPVSGGFRHMFVLHGSVAFSTLSDIGETPVITGMSTLLGDIDDATAAVDKSDPLLRRKAEATRYFVRACFAASDREWTLAHTLANQAHDALIVNPEGDQPYGFDAAAIDTNDVLARKRSRLLQIDQEILFFRHLCKRAIAESNDPNRRRQIYLQRAASDLRQSSDLTLLIAKHHADFATPINPLSLRQALAAVGLAFEWISNQGDAAYPVNKALTAILPETDDGSICWKDLGILQSAIPHNLDPGQLSELERAVSLLCQRTDAMEDSGAPGHSSDFWRFLSLRAWSMRILGNVITKLEMKGSVTPALDEEHLDFVQQRWERHQAFVQTVQMRNKDIDEEGTNRHEEKSQKPIKENHFLGGLLAAQRLMNAVHAEADEAAVGDISAMITNFGLIDGYCNKLDRFGFPRTVLRRLKELYAPAIFEHFANEYSLPKTGKTQLP